MCFLGVREIREINVSIPLTLVSFEKAMWGKL